MLSVTIYLQTLCFSLESARHFQRVPSVPTDTLFVVVPPERQQQGPVLVSRYLCPDLVEEPLKPPENPEEPVDPLPEKLLTSCRVRLKSDGLACTIIGVMVFAVHCSTVSGGQRAQRYQWHRL